MRSRCCWCPTTYLSVSGSVVPRTLPVAALSGFICFALMYWDVTPPEVEGGTLMQHPNVFQFFLTMASLLVAFHANSAYGRYWEGRTSCQATSSAWSQAVSSVMCCDGFSAPQQLYCGGSPASPAASPETSPVAAPSIILPSSRLDQVSLPDGRISFDVNNGSTRVSADIPKPPSCPIATAEAANLPSSNQLLSVTHGTPPVGDSRRPSHIAKISWGVAGPAAGRRKQHIIGCVDVESQRRPSWLHAHSFAAFKAQCVHLMSALHGVCMLYLLGSDTRYNRRKGTPVRRIEILGGLSKQEAAVLRNSGDQAFQVFHWISHLITTYRDETGSTLPQAMSTRFFTLLSSGMQAYDQACKIEDTPFPFPYVQVMFMLDLSVILISPVIVACWLQNIALAVVLTFLLVFTFHAIFTTAHIMENPFGYRVNDLPLLELHEDFVGRLRCLVDEKMALILNDMVQLIATQPDDLPFVSWVVPPPPSQSFEETDESESEETINVVLPRIISVDQTAVVGGVSPISDSAHGPPTAGYELRHQCSLSVAGPSRKLTASRRVGFTPGALRQQEVASPSDTDRHQSRAADGTMVMSTSTWSTGLDTEVPASQRRRLVKRAVPWHHPSRRSPWTVTKSHSSSGHSTAMDRGVSEVSDTSRSPVGGDGCDSAHLTDANGRRVSKSKTAKAALTLPKSASFR